MQINRGELLEDRWSNDMHIIFMLAEDTKQRSEGFFDIKKPSTGSAGRDFYDPSGIVKGWAIWQAAKLLDERGLKNYYVDAGGDIQTAGLNTDGKPWSVGIKNPLKKPAPGQPGEIVKTVQLSGEGIATSGTYIRGEHIYNPKTGAPPDKT